LAHEDPAVGLAKTALREHFTNKIGQPIKTPFYQSQLEVLYEYDFFPWIVTDALKELIGEGFLRLINEGEIPNFSKFKNVQKINFFVNSKAIQNDEDLEKMRKRVFNITEYVDKYSNVKNSEMLGKHAEALVENELRAQQFTIVGKHSNEYENKKWTKSKHNLDFIAKHNDGNLTVGVEVKNTLSLIEPKEVDIKIDICNELGIVPVFAVRWIKPYIECIRLQNGFSWVFKTQMYPLGNEEFVVDLFKKLSAEEKVNTKGYPLQFPVNVRTRIPDKSIKKFSDWVEKNKDNPPTVNTAYRCKTTKKEAEL